MGEALESRAGSHGDVFARLLTFPNVLITGHQTFFTAEALTAIAETTVANITARTRHDEAAARAVLGAGTPLGRLLDPHEVAAAVAWLASPEAVAINGQTLVIDGGGVQA